MEVCNADCTGGVCDTQCQETDAYEPWSLENHVRQARQELYKGTCTDESGMSFTDSCSNNYLIEYKCKPSAQTGRFTCQAEEPMFCSYNCKDDGSCNG